MSLAEAKPRKLLGRAKPRLAPPQPARSEVKQFQAISSDLGIELMPWQVVAATYSEALGIEDRWLYPEVAWVVGRQNGKTELLVPWIVKRLRAGRRIMHTAQNRELPREVFRRVADIMQMGFELASRPRFANGQEEIRTKGGGLYRIVAPTRGGARGPSNDDVIIDELREMDNFDFIAAAEPTLSASPNPQILYLSNAGEEDSVVLNTIRLRADTDPALAYLEWSAAPNRPSADRVGWQEANPAIGHLPGKIEYLERKHRSYHLAGTLAIFETEHLCRWVSTTRERLVDDFSWVSCSAEELEAPFRPALAFSMDPEGKRASAAIAWRQSDDTIALQLLYNVTGDPIDTDWLGEELRTVVRKLGITDISYDPLTDAVLAKFFRKPQAISGQKYANATAQFVNIVNAGKLRWHDADAVTDDLTWTSRKHDKESGSYEAVRSQDDHPITASLAAIRAVSMAALPPIPAPKVM